MHAVAAGGLGIPGESDLVQHLVDQPCGVDDHLKRALLGVQIDQNEVRVVETGRTANPRVVVDTPQVDQVQQTRGIAGKYVVDRLLSVVGGDQLGAQPRRECLRNILLEERLALNPVGIPPQRERPVQQVRQNQIGDGGIVIQNVALGVAFGRVEDFVQVGELEHVAVDRAGSLLPAREEDFGMLARYLPRVDIAPQSQIYGRAQVFVGRPVGVLHLAGELRPHPRHAALGLRTLGKGARLGRKR